MRTRRLLPLLLSLVVFLGLYNSCEKETNPPNKDLIQVSDQSVLTIVEEALQFRSVGLTYELEELTRLAYGLLDRPISADSCGRLLTDTLFEEPNPVNSFLGYQGSRTWQAYCNESNEPRSLTIHADTEPSYPPIGNDANWLFGVVVSEGTWSVRQTIGGTFEFSGTYKRWGYFNRESLSFYPYTLEIRPAMLNTVNPYLLETLTARFTLTFETKVGQDIVKKIIPGTLEFLGDAKVSLSMDEKNYELSLE